MCIRDRPIPFEPVNEKISLPSSETENETTLSSSPEANVINEIEKSVIDVPKTKVPEPEKEQDTVGAETQNEKHAEKKQKAPTHTKPKQYNLGDYF